MSDFAAYATAGLVAGLLTLFELDRAFYVPKSGPDRRKLWAWIATFVLTNAAIAIVTVAVLRALTDFEDWHWAIQGLAAGLAYMAAVRVKIATLPIGAEEVNVGVELIYDYAKDFVYKRINAIAKAARTLEINEMLDDHTQADLIKMARRDVLVDELLTTSKQRDEAQYWILSVSESETLSDDEKKLFLANYLCSGRRVSRTATAPSSSDTI